MGIKISILARLMSKGILIDFQIWYNSIIKMKVNGDKK